MKMKFVVEKIFYVLMVLSLLLVFAFLGSILITIIKNGWPAMSWDMVTKLPGGGFYIGKEGGVLNAIVGSVYIVGASTVLGLCISIPIVFFVNIYLKKDSKLANLTRLSFDVLYGIPSIVYGAFAFTIMIFFGLRTSLLGGIIVITLLIIPIFVRSMDEETKRECAAYDRELFGESVKVAEHADLVVFDEIMAAVNYGMVPERDVLEFLENRPGRDQTDGLEIVLTGRDPSEKLIAAADYVSEICKRKHPFDRGIMARRGVEY